MVVVVSVALLCLRVVVRVLALLCVVLHCLALLCIRVVVVVGVALLCLLTISSKIHTRSKSSHSTLSIALLSFALDFALGTSSQKPEASSKLAPRWPHNGPKMRQDGRNGPR